MGWVGDDEGDDAMSMQYLVRCDICGATGDANLETGWKVLRDFAYVKHACPKCSGEATRMVGHASYLIESYLSSQIRSQQRTTP